MAAFLLVSVLLIYHIRLICLGSTTFESNRNIFKIFTCFSFLLKGIYFNRGISDSQRYPLNLKLRKMSS